MEESLRRIEAAISGLEKRISVLEQQRTQAKGTQTPAQPASVPNPASKTYTPAKGPVVVESRKNSDGEGQGFSHFLGLIAVICFVLAGIFVVRLAIESGWLTAERQVGLVLLLGASLALAGRFLLQIEKSYRTYLSAAGSIVLYIGAYSSSAYFQVVSPAIAVIGGMAVTAVTLGLFYYHESEVFSVIAAVGTFVSPFLLGSQRDLLFDAAFFILWSSLFAVCSTYFRSRLLSLTAAYLSVGVFTTLYINTDGSSLLGVIAVQVVQFLIFGAGVIVYSIQNRQPLSQALSAAYFPILLFFYATTYYFLNKYDPVLAPWISLSFGAVVWSFYILSRRQMSHIKNLESREMVFAFLGVCLAHAGYFEILPGQAKPWILPLFLLGSYMAQEKKTFPQLSKSLKAIFTLVAGIEFLKILFELFSGPTSSVFPALVTAGFGFLYYLRGHELIKDGRVLFLNLLHLLAMLVLYRLAYDYGSLAVSGAWAVYSGVILFFGFQKKDTRLANSSLLVLMISAGKALIYDASQANSGIRILCLIMTGALLYFAGLLFKRVQSWKV